MTKKNKLKQAILSGQIKDSKTALQFVIQEKNKEELIKEIIPKVVSQIKVEPGLKGEVGETGPAGRDGLNGRDGKDGEPGKNGKDGKSPNISTVVQEATKQVITVLEDKIPTIPQIIEELPTNGQAVRDSLEMLQGEERLDQSAIKGLEKYQEISKTVKDWGRGGSLARNLYQLLDVHLTSPANGDNLVYNSANGLWENKQDISTYWSTINAQTGLTGDKTGSFNLTTTGQVTFGSPGISLATEFKKDLGSGISAAVYATNGISGFNAQLGVDFSFGVGVAGIFQNPKGGDLYICDDNFIFNATKGSNTAIANFMTDNGSISVQLITDTYAINATGLSNFIGATTQSQLGGVGNAGYFVVNPNGTTTKREAYIAQDALSTQYAGHFSDPTNTVYLADGTYAINAVGNSLFTGNATITGIVSGGHLKDTSLTSGRVPYITTGGQLIDNANLTYDTSTLKSIGSFTAYNANYNAVLAANSLQFTRSGGNSYIDKSDNNALSFRFNTGTSAVNAITMSYYGLHIGGSENPNAKLDIEAEDASAYLMNTAYRNESSGGGFLFRKSNGTKASPTAVVTDDYLLNFFARGYAGSSTWIDGSIIRVRTDGAFTTSSAPARIELLTTPSGSTTPVIRMTIDNAGHIFIASIRSGATQAGAGAVANEIWKTSGHATLPDNVLLIGV